MKKQVKSIRLDNDLITLVEQYIAFQASVFGSGPAFSSMVNNALIDYLHKQMKMWKMIAESTPLIERLPNGDIRYREFSEEQLKKINELEENAFSLFIDKETDHTP